MDRKVWHDDPALASESADRLAPVLGIKPEDLLADAQLDQGGDYVVDGNVAYDSGLQIAQMGIPGVKAERNAKRIYPEGDLASNLLGFLGGDQEGLIGIEADYDHQLGGAREIPGRKLPPVRRGSGAHGSRARRVLLESGRGRDDHGGGLRVPAAHPVS